MVGNTIDIYRLSLKQDCALLILLDRILSAILPPILAIYYAWYERYSLVMLAALCTALIPELISVAR